MKKIVILNATSEENEMLIECLRLLFPDCEIQGQSKRMESAKEVQAVSGVASSKSHYLK